MLLYIRSSCCRKIFRLQSLCKWNTITILFCLPLLNLLLLWLIRPTVLCCVLRCRCVWIHSHEQQDICLYWGPGRRFGPLLLSGLRKRLWPETCTSPSSPFLDSAWLRCYDCHHVDLLHGLPACLCWSCTGSLVLQVKEWQIPLTILPGFTSCTGKP